MELILVSSCLLGRLVRYDGAHKRSDSEVLRRWIAEGRVVPICPEIAGGLSVPRPPAEITSGAGGAAVLTGLSKVVDSQAHDVSAEFIAGAHHALQQVQAQGIRIAILKDGSPSCGSRYIYDGTFSETKIHERGVTAALLESAGVRVFSEEQFAQANELLVSLEKHDTA